PMALSRRRQQRVPQGVHVPLRQCLQCICTLQTAIVFRIQTFFFLCTHCVPVQHRHFFAETFTNSTHRRKNSHFKMAQIFNDNFPKNRRRRYSLGKSRVIFPILPLRKSSNTAFEQRSASISPPRNKNPRFWAITSKISCGVLPCVSILYLSERFCG